MKITYVFTWTHFDGTRETWRISDCTGQEALEGACRAGWKPPRWWQWWRWSDGRGLRRNTTGIDALSIVASATPPKPLAEAQSWGSLFSQVSKRMTVIATGQLVGSRICDLLGLRGDRTTSLTIKFPAGGAVEIHAVLLVDELTMDAITGELASEMKSYKLVPIEPEPLPGP